MAQGTIAAASSAPGMQGASCKAAPRQHLRSPGWAAKPAPGFYSAYRPPRVSSLCPLSTRSANSLPAPVPSLRGSDKVALAAHAGSPSSSRLTSALPASSPSIERCKAELVATKPPEEAAVLLQILARIEQKLDEDIAARRQRWIAAQKKEQHQAAQPAQKALHSPTVGSKAPAGTCISRCTVPRRSPPGSRPITSTKPRGSPGKSSGVSPTARACNNAPKSSLTAPDTKRLMQLKEVKPAQKALSTPGCSSPTKGFKSPAPTSASRSRVPSSLPGSRPTPSPSPRAPPRKCPGASPAAVGTPPRSSRGTSTPSTPGSKKLAQARSPARGSPLPSQSAVGNGTLALGPAVTGITRPAAKPATGLRSQRSGQAQGGAAVPRTSGHVKAARVGVLREQKQAKSVTPSLPATQQVGGGLAAAAAEAARWSQRAAELTAELGQWEGSWLSGVSVGCLESGSRLDERWLADLVAGVEGAEVAVPAAPEAAAAFWRRRVGELEGKLQLHREEGLVDVLSSGGALGDPEAVWRGAGAGKASVQSGSGTKGNSLEYLRPASFVSPRCGA